MINSMITSAVVLCSLIPPAAIATSVACMSDSDCAVYCVKLHRPVGPKCLDHTCGCFKLKCMQNCIENCSAVHAVDFPACKATCFPDDAKPSRVKCAADGSE